VASVVLVVLSIVVFAGGLRGPAVAVTVLDDAVVGWSTGLDAPWLVRTWEALAFLGSWWVLNTLGLGLVLALLVLRRFRHLILALIAAQLLTTVIYQLVGPMAQRPRPFGVEIRAGWGSWAMPSIQVASLAATLVVILYTLVPEGRWRQLGKLVATGVVALAGLGRVALGAEAPTDVLVGAAIGVTVPLVLFRLFAPNEVFPIRYRRGRAAHLDVTGQRGAAHPAWAGGPAGDPGGRGQAVRAFRVGRLDPAADRGQERPAQLPVRQALRPQPPARRPLVQAGPRAAVWPAGG
jgi:membrane-associated phospholipid phosphatase